MSIPYFMSALLSPVLGGLVDKIGGRAVVCFFSAATLAVVHSLMGFVTTLTPIVPMVGQGMAYSMFAAALWPSVPYLVPFDSIGMAYGVVTAVQNAGLAGIPLIVAGVYTASDDRYIPNVEILFVALAVLGSASALALNFTAPQLNKRVPTPFEENRGKTAEAAVERAYSWSAKKEADIAADHHHHLLDNGIPPDPEGATPRSGAP